MEPGIKIKAAPEIELAAAAEVYGLDPQVLMDSYNGMLSEYGAHYETLAVASVISQCRAKFEQDNREPMITEAMEELGINRSLATLIVNYDLYCRGAGRVINNEMAAVYVLDNYYLDIQSTSLLALLTEEEVVALVKETGGDREKITAKLSNLKRDRWYE